MRARRSLVTAALAALFVLALPLVAHAAAVHVSILGSDTAGNGSMGNPYATVQRGVDMAASGDDVLVGAGTFVGEISMRNGISIHGAGSAATTLQGSGTLPVITANSIGAGTTIAGFRITGGYSGTNAWGGGIMCMNSSLTIKDNTITGNTAWGGGGIGCVASSALIRNNVISGNTALHGGGLGIQSGSTVIDGNTISNNTINGGASQGYGAGVYAYGGTITNNVISGNVGNNTGTYGTVGAGIFANQIPILIANNTIVGNSASPTSGGVYNFLGNPTITNCIIWDNGDDLAAGATATYSNIGNGDAGLGNISSDPSFVSAASGDYRLNAGSACIDVATSTAAPVNDRDGVYRPQGAAPDIGAYEWFDASTAAPTVPTISSVTHPVSTWSTSFAIGVGLTGASGTVAPIGGYAITATKDASATPAATMTHGAVTETTVTVSSDGTYYVNATASDVVNNWSGPAWYGPIWIDTTAPSAPTLSSTSHTINVGSTDNRIALTLTGASDGTGSGVAGYSVLFTRDASDLPPATVNATAESTTSPALLSGEWYAHVRTGDNVGYFSATSHMGPFVIEVPAPDDYADTTAEDTLLSVGTPGLLSGPADVGDGSLVATLVADVAHGTLSISDDGSFSYLPDADFNGVDTFKFAAYDGINVSATRTATVTVTPLADGTSLEITSGWKTLSKYGESYSLTGRLLDGMMGGAASPAALVAVDSGMSDCQVILQSSTSATGFTDTSLTTTTGPDGSFVFSVTPRDMTYYRVRFAGIDDMPLPSTSDYVRVLPVALVSAPTVPTVYVGKAFVAEGLLAPRHTAGSKPVRIYKYRRVSGAWKSYGYVLATVADTTGGSKYKATITLPNSGSWRLAAYNLADAKHAGSWSGYTSVSVQTKGQLAVAIAYQNLGRGYQWGGTGPLVFDSSGFTKYVFAKSGISIPRTAKQQSTTGTYIARKDLKPGDLVFFYSPVSHVGIYVGNGMMIDCNHYGGSVGVRKLYPSYAGARRVW